MAYQEINVLWCRITGIWYYRGLPTLIATQIGYVSGSLHKTCLSSLSYPSVKKNGSLWQTHWLAFRCVSFTIETYWLLHILVYLSSTSLFFSSLLYKWHLWFSNVKIKSMQLTLYATNCSLGLCCLDKIYAKPFSALLNKSSNFVWPSRDDGNSLYSRVTPGSLLCFWTYFGKCLSENGFIVSGYTGPCEEQSLQSLIKIHQAVMEKKVENVSKLYIGQTDDRRRMTGRS